MMMIPRRDGLDIFDEVFNDPFFTNKENKIMKTDIREKGDKYILDVDVPGFSKEDIKIELEEGYLTVIAETNEENEEKDREYIHKERFSGKCARSYYVGEEVTEEDIKAEFKNGTLELIFPKEKQAKINNKKYIQIG